MNRSVAVPCMVHSNLLQKCRIERESRTWLPQSWNRSADLHSQLLTWPLKDIAPPLAAKARRRRTWQRSAWSDTRRRSSKSRPHNPTSIWAHWRISMYETHVESSQFCRDGAISKSQGWLRIHQLLGLCSVEQSSEYSRWWKKAPTQSQTSGDVKHLGQGWKKKW